MKQTNKYRALLVACSSLLAVSANAANPYYAAGDLVLYFQEVGGTKVLYADLGNAATQFRGTATGPDAANNVSIVNLSAQLQAAFGEGWASKTNLYVGLAGNQNKASSATLVNGDPGRTLYVSSARNSIGTLGAADSSTKSLTLSTPRGTAASGMEAQNNVFGDTTGNLGYNSDVIVGLAADSKIATYNPIEAGTQLAAFGAFDGGVQQKGTSGTIGTLSGLGGIEFALDLYRIQDRKNVAGQVGFNEPIGVGTYEGSFFIGSNGNVSFLTGLSAIPEPTTMVFTCLLAASGLTLRSRRTARTA